MGAKALGRTFPGGEGGLKAHVISHVSHFDCFLFFSDCYLLDSSSFLRLLDVSKYSISVYILRTIEIPAKTEKLLPLM